MKQHLQFACALLMLANANATASASPFDQLGWMQGCWMVAGSAPGSGEQWTSAAGGSMLGMSRTVKAGKTVEFEFMQIREAAPGQLAFIAQPSGKPPSTFPLLKQDGATVVFENKSHDFPQRIIYRPDGAHAMMARIEGTSNGKITGMDFPMKRVGCEATPKA